MPFCSWFNINDWSTEMPTNLPNTPPKPSAISKGIAAASYVATHGWRGAKVAANLLNTVISTVSTLDLLDSDNFLLNQEGMSKEAWGKTKQGQFSPEKQHENWKGFTKKIKLPVNLDTVNSFDTYLSTRKKDFDGFISNAQFVSAKAELDTLLNDDSKTKKVKQAFDEMKDGIERRKHDPDFNPLSYITRLRELRSEANRALDSQLVKDKLAINSSTSLAPEIKDALIKEIEIAHGKAQKTLDEAIAKNEKLLLNAAEHDTERFGFIMGMRGEKGSDKTTELLNELAEYKNIPQGSVTAGGGEFDPSKVDLNSKKFTSYRTMTGVVINAAGTIDDQDGKKIFNKFTMTLPRRSPGFGLRNDPTGGYLSWITAGDMLYYHGGLNAEDNVRSDLAEMVGRIKAGGFSAITINIDHPDEKFAKKIAQKAYEECLKKGFDPSKVVIKIKGVEQPLSNLDKTKDADAKKGLFQSSTTGISEHAKNLKERREKLLEDEIAKAAWKEKDEASVTIKPADVKVSIKPASTAQIKLSPAGSVPSDNKGASNAKSGNSSEVAVTVTGNAGTTQPAIARAATAADSAGAGSTAEPMTTVTDKNLFDRDEKNRSPTAKFKNTIGELKARAHVQPIDLMKQLDQLEQTSKEKQKPKINAGLENMRVRSRNNDADITTTRDAFDIAKNLNNAQNTTQVIQTPSKENNRVAGQQLNSNGTSPIKSGNNL